MSGHFDDLTSKPRMRSTVNAGAGGHAIVTADPVGVLLTVAQPSGKSYSITLDLDANEAVLLAGELERAALRLQRSPSNVAAERRA